MDGILILNDGSVSDFRFFCAGEDGATGMTGTAVKFDRHCSIKDMNNLKRYGLKVEDELKTVTASDTQQKFETATFQRRKTVDCFSMIYCELYLNIGTHENPISHHIDWTYKETFEEFVKDAIRDNPSVVEIALYWGGDELSRMQGDLLYLTLEKHEGRWFKVNYANSFEHIYENFPLKTLTLAPEFDDVV